MKTFTEVFKLAKKIQNSLAAMSIILEMQLYKRHGSLSWALTFEPLMFNTFVSAICAVLLTQARTWRPVAQR